jgi:DNA repair protein SbcD/Mre11
VRRGEAVVGTVTAAGHPTRHEERDLSAAFPHPPGGRTPPRGHAPHPGGLRGGAADHDRYAPSELPRLRAAGYDYWALGHIHLRQELSALPGIRFPGNLQGRNPRETGAKGALVVEVPMAGAAPRVEFVELAPIRWETIRAQGIEDAGSLGSLVESVGRQWEAAREEDPGLPGGEWIVRVDLSGPSPLHSLLRNREERLTLADELTRALGVLEVEVRTAGVRPALDPARYLERQDAAGEVLRLVQGLAGEGMPPRGTP